MKSIIILKHSYSKEEENSNFKILVSIFVKLIESKNIPRKIQLNLNFKIRFAIANQSNLCLPLICNEQKCGEELLRAQINQLLLKSLLTYKMIVGNNTDWVNNIEKGKFCYLILEEQFRKHIAAMHSRLE